MKRRTIRALLILQLCGLIAATPAGAFDYTFSSPSGDQYPPVVSVMCAGDGPIDSSAHLIQLKWNGTSYVNYGHTRQSDTDPISQVDTNETTGSWMTFARKSANDSEYPVGEYKLIFLTMDNPPVEDNYRIFHVVETP
jgi:hypothetical protein